MTGPQTFRMVVKPASSFAAIAAALEQGGFVAVPGAESREPLVPGEPEYAAWHVPDADAAASYSCNPVIGLRVLVFSGEAVLAPMSLTRDRLAVLDSADLAALLGSPDPREQMCGIHAAVELSAFGLIGEIEALRVGSERAVTAAAARGVEQLSLALLELGAERIAAERARRPGYSMLFTRLGDAETRRAMLLELLADGDGTDEETCAVLRSGLTDTDWRVRLTAMLVAVRLGASAVGPEVRALDFTNARLDRRHRSALGAARKAAMAELARLPAATPTGEAAQFAVAMRNLVAGRDYSHPEPLLAWVGSFATAESTSLP
ncbi:MAG: hypothetical protein ACKOPM_00570 [Novosphingobium sp.]